MTESRQERIDDTVADPKTGGFDKPGAGKVDDTVADPKTGGFDRTSR